MFTGTSQRRQPLSINHSAAVWVCRALLQRPESLFLHDTAYRSYDTAYDLCVC